MQSMPPLQYTRKDTESPEPGRAPGRQRLRCFAGAEGAKVSNDFFIFSVNVKQNTAHITPHAYGGCGGGGRVIRSACGCVLTLSPGVRGRGLSRDGRGASSNRTMPIQSSLPPLGLVYTLDSLVHAIGWSRRPLPPAPEPGRAGIAQRKVPPNEPSPQLRGENSPAHS